METSNTSISGVRTDLLIPESDTSTCTMIVMERRPNALEKYERPESKSDGYCQKSFYRQQRDDRKTKKLTKTYKAMHSNNTTVQNPKKPAQPAQKAQEPPERPETRKRGLFRSPIFRITCIIRNIIKIKNRGPLLLRSVIGAGFGSLCCSFISFRLGRVDRLPSRHRKIQLDKTAFMRASIASDFTAVYPAAVFRSTRRSLHSKRAPLSYSLLRFQTVQRPLRWSQSTVLPEPPDSLHLPTR